MRNLVLGNCEHQSPLRLADPDAPNEAEFCNVVVKGLRCAFPEYDCVAFSGTFRLDDTSYKPDLALVAKDQSHWFVVEVELLSHSLELHVLPQVRALVYGQPLDDCSVRLSSTLGISRSVAETLVRFVPRKTLVVANKRDQHWKSALAGLDVQMLVVTLFGGSGLEAIEVDGDIEVRHISVGFGQYLATDRSVRFGTPVDLPLGIVQVNDREGGLSNWNVSRSGAVTWLTKEAGTATFEDEAYVQLVRTMRGGLSFVRPNR